MIDSYDLVSVDDHVIEPPGVWSDRLPKQYLEDGPHVIEADGRQYWVYEGERTTTMGLNAVAGKSREEYSMEPARFTDMIPGCYDPVQRGRDLGEQRNPRQPLFPDVSTLCGRHLPAGEGQGARPPLRAGLQSTSLHQRVSARRCRACSSR